MSDHTEHLARPLPNSTTSTPAPTAMRRSTARWMVTFLGFPLGGVTAEFVVGPVDGPRAAILGGLITGSILGAVQAWGLGRNRPSAALWVAATAAGLAVGLAAAAAAVDYRTSLGAVVIQGAICGLAVGLGQAFVLRARLGLAAFTWPLALAAVWAIGWAVTTLIGVQVDQQFTVFGSSGALAVTALTAVLPYLLTRNNRSAS